jgi:hypothetical protein
MMVSWLSLLPRTATSYDLQVLTLTIPQVDGATLPNNTALMGADGGIGVTGGGKSNFVGGGKYSSETAVKQVQDKAVITTSNTVAT